MIPGDHRADLRVPHNFNGYNLRMAHEPRAICFARQPPINRCSPSQIEGDETPVVGGAPLVCEALFSKVEAQLIGCCARCLCAASLCPFGSTDRRKCPNIRSIYPVSYTHLTLPTKA